MAIQPIHRTHTIPQYIFSFEQFWRCKGGTVKYVYFIEINLSTFTPTKSLAFTYSFPSRKVSDFKVSGFKFTQFTKVNKVTLRIRDKSGIQMLKVVSCKWQVSYSNLPDCLLFRWCLKWHPRHLSTGPVFECHLKTVLNFRIQNITASYLSYCQWVFFNVATINRHISMLIVILKSFVLPLLYWLQCCSLFPNVHHLI